jgi:hypothetical protein
VRRTLEGFDLPDHLLGPGVRDVLLYPPSRRAPIRLSSDRDEYRVADMAGVYNHARLTAEAAGAQILLGVRFAGASQGVARLEAGEPVRPGSSSAPTARARGSPVSSGWM